MYGKQTECAIAVMSRLAEVYNGGKTHLTTTDIARSRGLQLSYVKKIIGVLSRSDLVTVVRGPGGGTTMARDPKTITLEDVFNLFEFSNIDDVRCPFRTHPDNLQSSCILHEKLMPVRQAMINLLKGTTFEVFCIASGSNRSSSKVRRKTKTKGQRKSYRAPRTASSRPMMFQCPAMRLDTGSDDGGSHG